MSEVKVVSFGGGTNSTAMLIGMVRCGIVPDAILFADTGGERPEVYKHVEAFSEWLKTRGFPEIVWVRQSGKHESLENECLNMETLPSLAFGFKTCSQKHKVQPQDKWCNNWQPARDCWASGNVVVKYIGYDAGPRDRSRARVIATEKYTNRYPLIEWGWDRAICARVCREEGFEPEKSACFFCPAMKKHEVLRLKETHPDLLARAIAMEENAAPNLETVKGLGRRWSWKSLIANDDAQGKLWGDDGADEIPCACYDGGEQ